MNSVGMLKEQAQSEEADFKEGKTQWWGQCQRQQRCWDNADPWGSWPGPWGQLHTGWVRSVPTGVTYKKFVIAVETPFCNNAWSESASTLEAPKGNVVSPWAGLGSWLSPMQVFTSTN